MVGIQRAKKGYFPHFFNRKETQYYMGELPPVEDYGINKMKNDGWEEFPKWWEDEKQSEGLFHFSKEMLQYCRYDVSILRQATMKFRNSFILLNSVTITAHVWPSSEKFF